MRRKHILAIRFFDNFFTVKINGTGGVQRFHDIWECIVGWDLDVVNVEGVERDPLLHASIGIPQRSPSDRTTSIYFAWQHHCNQHSLNWTLHNSHSQYTHFFQVLTLSSYQGNWETCRLSYSIHHLTIKPLKRCRSPFVDLYQPFVCTLSSLPMDSSHCHIVGSAATQFAQLEQSYSFHYVKISIAVHSSEKWDFL